MSAPSPSTEKAISELLGDRAIDQVSFVVEHLPEAVDNWNALHQGEWLIYTYGPGSIPFLEYHGQPGSFSMRLALQGATPQIELIQAVDGPSIYHDWIDEHGYGFHHIGYFVPSLSEAISTLADRNVAPVMTGGGYGEDGDGGFAYFDCSDTTGIIVELIEVPRVRRPSESLVAT